MKLADLCCSFPLLLLLISHYLIQNSNNQPISVGERLALGSILQPNQILVSRNGSFTLGYSYSMGYGSYWGVSLSEDDYSQIWVANRNHPAGDGAVLRLSRDGNLVISDADQNSTVWTSGTSGMNISSMLLEESGNLILTRNDVSGSPIWQSFDHPTDTWIAGMKFYVGSTIVASKSPHDLAEGRFALRMLETLALVSVWNKSKAEYWSSGVWNGHIFPGIQELMTDLSFSFSNGSGRPYFTFTWNIENNTLPSARFVLEFDGILRLRNGSSWNYLTMLEQPADPCQVDHLCGQNGICSNYYSDPICSSCPSQPMICNCPPRFKAFDPTGWSSEDWSMGCVPDINWNPNIKQFSILHNTSYDQGSAMGSSVRSYSGHNQTWCEASCTSDCACKGFSFDAGSSNCSLHYGPLFNGKTSPHVSQNFFLRWNCTKQSPSDQFLSAWTARNGNRKMAWIIGLGIAVGCASLLLIALLMWRILPRKRFAERQSSKYISEILKNFSYKELQKATGNFSETLGSGGFGSVYKGSLRDHTMIAVKKLHNLKQGDKDFRTEIRTIGMIQHVNLVKLRGFCAEDMHRLLVYEYMPNASLNTVLFTKPGEQQHIVLSWDTRFAIALGTARGIMYLHEECRSCIIHCDIKPENILLDANFSAKLSDFGLAKLMDREFSRVITNMRGTRGYLAPEWLSSLPITAKADVYSYGMTLFEIISGRKNVEVNNSSLDKWFFPLWACRQAALGDFSSLADIKLCGKINAEQLKIAVLVAIWCIQDEEIDRPSMARVVKMLEGTLQVTDPPLPKSLRYLEVEMRSTSDQLELSKLAVEEELEESPT